MTAWVLSLLLAMGVARSSHTESVAEAISGESKGDRELAAFMAVLGWYESRYAVRIADGRCKVEECDRGRARGPWQVHRRAGMSQGEWDRMHGVEHVEAQAREIAGRIRAARKRCKSLESRGVDWALMAFSSLAGRGCTGDFRGRAERVARFRALVLEAK